MLSRLWRTPLSASVIDCHHDAPSDTISACDTNGRVVVVDSDTVLCAQARVSMPAWGVAHSFDAGDPLIAVAEARKPSNSDTGQGGALSIIDGAEEPRLRVPVATPCWDVVLTGADAWCSAWGGDIIRMSLDAKAADDARVIKIGGQAYGLALHNSDGRASVLVCAADRGILEINPEAEKSLGTMVRAASAAYNVTRRGQVTIAGSTDPGVVVMDAPAEGHGAVPVALAGQVSAVGIVGDEFLVAGDLDGSLALFDISRLDRPLDGLTLPGGVWNLSIDPSSNRIYVACGDGHLYALEVGLDIAWSRERVKDLRDVVATRPVAIKSLLDTATSAGEVSIALAEIGAVWSDYSRGDVDALAEVLRRWATEHPSARLFFRLGLAELERKQWDDSIVALQKIEQTSDSYIASLLPLAEAFDGSGSPRTAVNVLKANLERFPAISLLDVLFRIGQLSEKCRDTDGALTAYEAVSFHDHSYPGIREALTRLREAGDLVAPNSEDVSVIDGTLERSAGKLSRFDSRRRLAYDQISYVQYDYGPAADQAKKLLEEHGMNGVLSKRFPEPGRSLDIGCATGRWPIWFARHGWEAMGYDIEASAIEICELKAQKMQSRRPEFHLYDICDGALELDGFQIVTTMMGTFNHIGHGQLSAFLRGIWDSLMPGGVFVFTTWNAQSRFCDFLNLDGEHAKENLRRNYMDGPEITARLLAAGFEDVSTNPIVFLPNSCYDVWADMDDPEGTFIEFDEILRRHVAANKAQMQFFVSIKPGR
jgi:SAM-dependent methyltransferase